MSKFLRQMAALSKKPSDFQGKKPETVASPSLTVDDLATVDRLATVDKLSVAAKPLPAERSLVDLVGSEGTPAAAKPGKPADLAQHGHTPGEHALYTALWNLGGKPEHKDEFRDVTI